MQNQNSYYAIIPADVRYDEDLPPNAKLLYGEITALCNEKGFCWASNQHFALLYSVNKTTVSEWVSKLESKGHIRCVMLDKTTRHIYITKVSEKAEGGLREKPKGASGKAEHNITSNTTNKTLVLFEEFWKEYPNRKRDRDKCLEKFSSFKEDIQKAIVEDVKVRKVRHSDWVKNDHQFVPAPLVYLRNKRWEEPIDNKGSGIKNVYHNSESDAVSKIKERMASRK